MQESLSVSLLRPSTPLLWLPWCGLSCCWLRCELAVGLLPVLLHLAARAADGFTACLLICCGDRKLLGSCLLGYTALSVIAA